MNRFGNGLWQNMVVLGLLMLATAMASAQTFTVLHNFDLGADGGVPYAGVTLDQQGRIYGTTSDGGTRNGVVYRMVQSGAAWILTPIYTFHGQPDGAVPYAGVVFGPDGALYGTTSYGGAANAGTVFRLRPPAASCGRSLCPWSETILYSFTGGTDGGYPGYGNLTFDSAGNIYGTTVQGGSTGNGVVFELTRSGNAWTESVLWNFTGGSDGGLPYSGVMFDNSGNLFGTAAFDSSGGYGAIYELSPSPSGWTERTLYAFTGNDGGNAVSGLIRDGHGNLFGMTGGIEPGAAYELSPSLGSWRFRVLQTFTGSYPGPFFGPTLDANGNLYGPLPTGGVGNGEIFKLTADGNQWDYSSYYNFVGPATEPLGSVTFDAAGNMYGTTISGGSRTWGTVWMITP